MEITRFGFLPQLRKNLAILPQTTLSSTSPDTLHLTPSLHFASQLLLNHGIKLPQSKPIDFEQAGQFQVGMIRKSIELQGKSEKSPLVVEVDCAQAFLEWPATISGVIDSITTSPVTVNTLVSNYTERDGLLALQSATGMRYMNAAATVNTGPAKAAGAGTTTDIGHALRTFYEHQRDMEWLVAHRAGMINSSKKMTRAIRDQIDKDLNNGKLWNALMCLTYGKTGLVDAIIVKSDKIITRQTLEDYY